MIYALWDTETNNLVDEYGDIEQALMLVRNGIERNGPQDTDGLLLQEETEHGDVRPIAFGQQLAALARTEVRGNVPSADPAE
jgi:hypothetical protein